MFRGCNVNGVLALGDEKEKLINYSYPTEIPYFKTNPAIYLAAGNNHAAAIKSNGELVTWGKNHEGALGLAGISNDQIIGSPHAVASINRLGPIVSVSCGTDFTAAIVNISNVNCLYAW
jgi:alpha-tubulin suppressor-like RCC1 family protein